MNSKEREEYCEFMYDKNNVYNCEHCPEYKDPEQYVVGHDQLPCGQYKCWVEIHNIDR